MKTIFSLCFALLTTIAAQSQKKTFIRIFDEAGRKTHKGYLTSISDTSVTLSLGEKTFEIPADQIGTIKLKRSFGHTVLLTTILGGVSFAILGAATADPNAWIFAYTAGQGALAGFLVGIGIGSIPGAIISAFQKRPVLDIHQDHNEWMKVKEHLRSYLPVNKK